VEPFDRPLQVDPAVIQQANNMGTSTGVRLFPVLIIPGVSDEQIAERSR
jgi:hypothetical protein